MNKVGRPELEEKSKRKVKQLRLSDEEMEQLGNPNSTQMREMLFKMMELELFCKKLDEKGINLIPNGWLDDHYEKDSPFCKIAINDNYLKLWAVVNAHSKGGEDYGI